MGNISPNQTTSGRIKLPQWHLGTEQPGKSSRSPYFLPQPEHLFLRILPCSSQMFLLPALKWRLSTFWVQSEKCGKCFSISTNVKCAGFGRTLRMIFLRNSYHSHTSCGFLKKASGLANSSALNLPHKPSLPLKVGTPLSAEIPAPVSTATLWAVNSLL